MATLDVALYCYPGSLYSSIARLGLAEKHVRYEERLVDIGPAMRSYAPQYMRINPRGVVPTLEVRGERITDATRIIAWVDEHLPGFIARAEERLRAAKEAGHHDAVDDAAKLLADMVAMGDHIGIS